MPSRPNILYIHSHDTGRWISPYGYDVPMPAYQRLAEQGTLFRQAFCMAPTCSPSRAALLTGCSPHSAGMLGLAHRGFRLADPRRHLLHTLKSVGYTAVLAGVQHVFPGSDMPQAGYDRVRAAQDLPTEQFAAEFMHEAASDQPFFLDVGFFETHRSGSDTGFDNEKAGDEAGDGRYFRPPVTLPDTPATRRDAADFRQCAIRLDRKVGVVLDALEAAGKAANTLVITTTDHGPPFPGMKCNLTDHGIGVLLILRGPGIPEGAVTDALVAHVDVFPTLCDLVGIPKPDWLEGKSLVPLLTGQSDEANDEIFAEVTYHAAYEPMRAIRTKRWKYIRHWGDRQTTVLPNVDDSPSKNEWLAHGWGEQPVPAEALYDLVFDPQERENRADDPEYAAVCDDLRARLNAWMERTHDPLLAGNVPAPSGAKVNEANGISPREEPFTIP